ncbi:MAG: hypothetical protein AAFY65_15460 [Pseudomonadota bacterium]
MSYVNGIFVKREAERQALRDKKRDAFFADYDAPRLKDPFLIEVDPAAQQQTVFDLLEENLSLHGADTTGLTMMRAELASLAFGLPTVPVGLPHQLTLADAMPEGMLKSNFAMGWAGWFDDG